MARGRKRDEPFDPHELGARRSDPTLAALEPIPELFSQRVNPKRLLVYFAIGVVAVAAVREGRNALGPSLATSCTKAAYSVSSSEVKTYGVLSWSATGPNGTKIVFALDSATPPTTHDDGLLASPGPLKGCKAHGQFGVATTPGKHVLTVFAVSPAGVTSTVGTKALTVD